MKPTILYVMNMIGFFKIPTTVNLNQYLSHILIQHLQQKSSSNRGHKWSYNPFDRVFF